jgi:glycosyltransferase involved in cell wall biosynthesis
MITVIVPTYNRGDILARTVPKYLDARVSAILVVDDGSRDHTAGAVAELHRRDARIQYLKNDGRRGSVFSRNRGLQTVRTPYFLMTDDDTYPDAEFFDRVLETMAEQQADVIAVRKLLLNEQCDEHLARRSGGQGPPVDYDRMAFFFDTTWTGRTTTVPGTYFAKRAVAAAVSYDAQYRGSAWREETDFGLAAHLAGHSIFFEPRAVVFELPKTEHRGGQWDRPLASYVASAIRNNWYFLNKFHAVLKREQLVHRSIWALQCRFILGRLGLFVIVPAKRILGPRVIMLVRKLVAGT